MGLTARNAPTRDEQIALTVAGGLVWALILTTGVWYWRRRLHSAYIAQRQPFWSLTAVGAVGLSVALDFLFALLWDPNLPCSGSGGVRTFMFVHSSSFLLIFSSSLWRCAVLISQYEAQRIRLAVQLRAAGRDAPFDANWFQTHIDWLTARPVQLLLVVYTLAPGIAVATRSADGGEYSETTGLCELQAPITSNSVLAGALCLILLALKVRTVKDGFAILTELGRLGVLALVVVVINLGISFGRSSFAGSVLHTVYWLAVILVIWAISIATPIYHTYYPPQHHAEPLLAVRKQPNAARKRAPNADGVTGAAADGSRTGRSASVSVAPVQFKSLSEVLRNPLGKRAFERHLMLEFSLENLVFCDDVDALRAAVFGPTPTAAGQPPTTPHGGAVALSPPVSGGAKQHSESDAAGDGTLALEDVRALATAIYRKYVASNAPFQVNLSSENSGALHIAFADAQRSPAQSLASVARHLPHFAGASSSPSATNIVKRISGSTKYKVKPSPNAVAAAAPALVGVPTDQKVPLPKPLALQPIVESPAVSVVRIDPPQTLPVDSSMGGRGDVALATLPPPPQPAHALGPYPSDSSTATVGTGMGTGFVASGAEAADASGHTASYYAGVFDAAYSEVIKLLQADSFVRFIAGPLYDELVRTLALAQAAARRAPLDTPTHAAAAATAAASLPFPSSPSSPSTPLPGATFIAVAVRPTP